MKKAFCILTILLLLPACGARQVDEAHGPAKEAAKCGKERAQALTDAVKKGNLDKVRELLDAGADVNTKNDEGETFLHMAARNGSVELADILMAEGAGVNTNDEYGNTPLHLAKDIAIAAFLIAGGADTNVVSKCHSSPLSMAAMRGDIETVSLLIEQGVRIRCGDLMGAAAGGHGEVVKLLIAEGADVNEKGYWGNGPLHLAAQFGHEEVAEILIADGADVDARDVHGQTPLHPAAQFGQTGIIEFLIRKGANPNLGDIDHATPLDWAKTEEIKELLRAHGGKSGKELKESEGK